MEQLACSASMKLASDSGTWRVRKSCVAKGSASAAPPLALENTTRSSQWPRALRRSALAAKAPR
jgi:hypothetical protein